MSNTINIESQNNFETNKRDFFNSTDWIRAIASGYTKAFVFFALTETGVLNILRKDGGMAAKELAEEARLDEHLLDGILNYAAFSDDVIEKKGNRYWLTQIGTECLFSETWRMFAYAGIGSYSCLLYHLVPALKGQKKYGIDFERRGDFLAVGSHLWGKGTYQWIVDECRNLKIRNLADLGCGSADVLIDFCKLDPSLMGIGIDISSGALEEAKIRLKEHNLQNHIRLVEADLTKPEQYMNQIGEVEGFHALMVIHEFLRYGEDWVVQYLRNMQSCFPGRYCFIGEFNNITDEEYRDLPIEDRQRYLFYQYIIHPLSLQGLPMEKPRWLDLFKRANIQVLKVQEHPVNRLVTYVLRFNSLLNTSDGSDEK